MSHSLNLLASQDASIAVTSDNQYKKLYRSITAKCSALSKAVHVSSKNAEIVQELLQHTIPKPNSTRWNSEYDCLKCVYGFRDKINIVMERLKLAKFMDREVEFLGEWVKVMNIVAIAIDKMQGEDTVDSYFGAILPALHTIKRKLDFFVPTHTRALVLALQSGLQKRFGEILTLDDFSTNMKRRALLIAAICHPYFKLRWLPNGELQQVAEDIFLSEVTRLTEADNTNNVSTTSLDSDNYYGFTATSTPELADSKVCAMQYLRDPSHDIHQLKKYPDVCNMFIKFNTTITSSAPVERLFSAAGQILLPRRNRLTDNIFEQLLLLKKNKQFFINEIN